MSSARLNLVTDCCVERRISQTLYIKVLESKRQTVFSNCNHSTNCNV